MRKVLITLGIIVMLLLAAVPSSAVEVQNVCRDLPSGTQAPGSVITVSLDTTVGSATYYGIDEMVPSGWTVTWASDAGDYTSDPGHVKWAIVSGAADKTYTYTVQIPGAADGTYSFSGEFQMEGMSSASPIDCDPSVTVEVVNGGSDGQDVCRDLPSGTQAPGSVITVSLDTTVGSATYYGIDEMVPSGWTVTWASDAGDYTSDPGHVKWAIVSGAADKTYTYTVQIPGAADGTYSFSGEFQMEGMSSASPIDCDPSVTVEAGAVDLGEPNVCRDLPSGTQTPGSMISVSLDTTIDSATFYAIDEEVPSGWIITGASDAGDYTSESGHVKWVVTSGAVNKTYTYTVQIPGAAADGTYAFGPGEFQMEGMSSSDPIDCDTDVTVEAEVIPDGIMLMPGWNFISVPYELDNSSVDNILADINYSALTYYNTNNSSWDPVTTFDPLKGYWIKSPMDEDVQVILAEVLVPKVPTSPAMLQLYAGWNSIGYTDSMDILSAELTLQSIDDYYTLVLGPWIPDTMVFEYVGHNGQTGVIENRHVGTDIFDMSAYNGYWVFVTQDCMLNSIGG